MKRVFLIIIGIYLVVGGVLIFLIKEKSNEIKFFTLEQNYLRLMTQDESLVISFFIDSEDSFLTEIDNISSSSLRNEYSEIVVNIGNVEQKEDKITYQNEEYFVFSFDLKFREVDIDDFTLNIEDCFLKLSYNNGEVFELSIGDVYLDFNELNASDHLDYTSLVGVSKTIDNKNYLVGLYLKFDNITNRTLVIKRIFTNSDKLAFDLNNLILTVDKIADNENLLNKLGESTHLGEIVDKSFIVDDSYYYLIPIVYQENYQKIYRFPLYIEYTYNNETFILETDDTVVFNDYIRLDDYVDAISFYSYIYPESN